MLEGVQDYAILMLSPEGRIMTWNAGAQAMKGYGAQEIIGQSFSRFYTETDLHAQKPVKLLKGRRTRRPRIRRRLARAERRIALLGVCGDYGVL